MRQIYHDDRKTQRVIGPQGGWEDETWYLVDLEVNEYNPRHRSLFYSGFVTGPGGRGDGTPGNYNAVTPINGNGEDHIPIERVKYLRVVRRLFSTKELKVKEPVAFPNEKPLEEVR